MCYREVECLILKPLDLQIYLKSWPMFLLTTFVLVWKGGNKRYDIYWIRLLKRFYHHLDIPTVLNTSLNQQNLAAAIILHELGMHLNRTKMIWNDYKLVKKRSKFCTSGLKLLMHREKEAFFRFYKYSSTYTLKFFTAGGYLVLTAALCKRLHHRFTDIPSPNRRMTTALSPHYQRLPSRIKFRRTDWSFVTIRYNRF